MSPSARSGRCRFILWLPVIVYMGVLFWLSSLHTVPGIPNDPENRLAHFAAYAGLAMVTLRAFADGEWRGVTAAAAIGAVTIASLYGVSDEYHQHFVPGRTFDVFDMVADALGAIGGASVVWVCSIMRRRSQTRHVL